VQLDEVLRLVSCEATRAYATRPFLASDWYDAMPLAYLNDAVARHKKIPLVELGATLGAFHARASLSGMYQALMNLFPSQSLAAWLPKLLGLNNDFGRVLTTQVATRHFRVVRTGLPRFNVFGWCVVAQGFLREALRMGGVRSVAMAPLEPELDGEVEGYPTYKVPFDLRLL
jgi:hypothetical protein